MRMRTNLNADGNDTVRHAKYVKEVTQHLDYNHQLENISRVTGVD